MQLSWISEGRTKIVAIVGICKNAGKTTVLNAVLKQHDFSWGVLSTGRDGEREDLVYKTPKPRVLIPAGSFFCCDTQGLQEHGSRIELGYGLRSGNRRLWLVKALAELETEITGPSNAEAQLACARKLLALGAEKIIIDGSLDRKSIVLNEVVDGIILVAGASFGSQEAISQELQRLLLLSELKVYPGCQDVDFSFWQNHEVLFKIGGHWESSGLNSLIGHDKELSGLLLANPEAIYIPGAFTSSVHHRLGAQLQSCEIVFRHPECIKLEFGELQDFLGKNRVNCIIPFVVKTIAVNAHGVGSADISADELRNELSHKFCKLPVIDVMALEEA